MIIECMIIAAVTSFIIISIYENMKLNKQIKIVETAYKEMEEKYKNFYEDYEKNYKI